MSLPRPAVFQAKSMPEAGFAEAGPGQPTLAAVWLQVGESQNAPGGTWPVTRLSAQRREHRPMWL